MDGLTVGRVVHYVLSEKDAQSINERNSIGNDLSSEERVPAIVYHGGNRVREGQHCAMVIVHVWDKDGMVNGQVLLDGVSNYWATSVRYSDIKASGSWHWIEKA